MNKKWKVPPLSVVVLFDDGSEECFVLSSREAYEKFYFFVEYTHLCYSLNEKTSLVSVTLRDCRGKTIKQFVNLGWSDHLKKHYPNYDY